MAESVKVIDRGWNDIKKMLKKYAGGTVAAAGIQGDAAAADHGGITNAELGAIHEFGTKDGKIPERSHFRATADEGAGQFERELTKIAKDRVFSGKDADGEVLLMGERYIAKVKAKIQSGLQPDIKEKTREAPNRGEGPPLWNTGQYINSMSTQLVDLEKVARQ